VGNYVHQNVQQDVFICIYEYRRVNYDAGSKKKKSSLQNLARLTLSDAPIGKFWADNDV